ncbi:DUF4439 domain-containing protein [Sinomonas terrae]|uniref:DUF4439 domain-containing protein n=1 Tax=Sinomonas terrae TaxID=2908838 RepID=A0ABS9U3T6_9MICC|nr:DUF4439 domain-containing protein [Sinomonas terrae]MCH6470935.1 DUF4439 domain-containing protein [Sinomonas terrae]
MSSDTVPSTPSTPPSDSSGSSTPPGGPSGNTPRTRPWRYWALGAAAILVALGSATLVAIQAPQPASPSKSEAALHAAHEDALRLASLAHSAAGSSTASGAQAALSTAATVLDRQAAVLGGPPPQGTPGAATPTGPAAVGTAPVSTTPTPPAATPPPMSDTANPTSVTGSPFNVTGSAAAGTVQAKDLAAGLASSVQARLAALPDVDAPTATLLASVAAGQSVQLDALAAATGAPASAQSSGSASPTLSASATTSNGPTPSTGPCPSPTATASYGGTGFSGALAAAERAESAAVYLLQTAIARTPAGSPDAAARSSALDAHRRQLASVDSLAAAACTALPPRDAGFAVPPNFASDPSTALKAVEGSSEEAWAQLVGEAPGARRGAAAAGLVTAARLAEAASPSEATAFPGVPTAQ